MGYLLGNVWSGGASPVSLPDWVPVEGTFADIGLNTMADVAPTGWPSNDIAGPFANWSGGVYASDFSTLGAYVVHGSGHLDPNTNPIWAGVWCFDLDTLEWVGRNVPSAALTDEVATKYDSNGESTETATLGHTYVPHTYDGLAYLSAALSGKSKGSLTRAFFGGASLNNAIHEFDLSSTTAAATRVVDDITMSGINASYPQVALDSGRGCLWVLTYGGPGPLKQVTISDWSVTSHTGVEFNAYGNFNLIYVPAPYDCLVSIGSGSGGLGLDVYVCPIVSDVPQGFTLVTQSGTAPADSRCGGQWSTLLSKIVCYESAGSFDVHKLTVPTDLTGGTWAWSSETLTGVSSATPSRNAVADNGAWGRFIEVPAAKCFIWCDSVTQAVQAWRLTGMT